MPRPALRSRDWLFGSDAKRKLLMVLIEQPEVAWTKGALAREIGVHPKGALDQHLAALRELGVARHVDERWQLDPLNALVEPLRRLLDAVADIPDKPLDRGRGKAG
jgi:hypothetical protein